LPPPKSLTVTTPRPKQGGDATLEFHRSDPAPECPSLLGRCRPDAVFLNRGCWAPSQRSRWRSVGHGEAGLAVTSDDVPDPEGGEFFQAKTAVAKDPDDELVPFVGCRSLQDIDLLAREDVARSRAMLLHFGRPLRHRPTETCDGPLSLWIARYERCYRGTIVRNEIALCASCGGAILRPTTGRLARFCSVACRNAAYRRRKQNLPEDASRVSPGGRHSLLERMTL